MLEYGLAKKSLKLLYGLCLMLFGVLCQAQEKKVYEIGFLVDHQDAAMEPLMQQLRAEISAVVGEDATIVYAGQSVFSN